MIPVSLEGVVEALMDCASQGIRCAVFREGDTVEVVLHNKEAKRQLTLMFEPAGMSFATIDENMKRTEHQHYKGVFWAVDEDDLRKAFLWLDRVD